MFLSRAALARYSKVCTCTHGGTTEMNPDERDLIFYDGHCGLCHRWVKRVLEAGPPGERFRVSPLQGETIKSMLSEPERSDLPDSVVVRTSDGQWLYRSDATVYILENLGPPYRRQAKWLACLPRWLRDLGYRMIAGTRRLFGRPKDVCPMVTESQRERFLP